LSGGVVLSGGVLITLRMKGGLTIHQILYKFFHIKESIECNAHEIDKQNKALAALHEDQHMYNKALEACSAVMQKEKKIKRVEKALDAKVFCTSTHVELN
jgi:hypothetical protein